MNRTQRRPRKNIICFPYGGGNGTIYMDLAEAMQKVSDEYCIYTVNLLTWIQFSKLHRNTILS